MTIIKSTLKLALILYICTALAGVFALSASARITPKQTDDEETTLITIEKGDTLWDLCQKHLKDPLRWRELSKYNDFTDPNWIYPGEKLRIPIAMINGMKKQAEEDLVKQQEDLEKLRSELAESESKRETLMDEIKDLKTNSDKLQKQIKALEASLKSQDKLLDAFKESSGTSAADLKKVIRNNKNALQKQLNDLRGHIDKSNEMLSNLQKELKATQEHIKGVHGDVGTVLKQVEANQKAIGELKMIIEDAKGIHEEVSSAKRALVFITTAVAGIGWFVINSIGGRSGE